jgi:UDP-glucose 4-epimerase
VTAPLSWVVGAGGLLGGSVVKALSRQGRQWAPAGRLAWADPPSAVGQLRAATAGFLAAAGERPWQVAWCAGAGVTATGLAHLERELEYFTALLEGLGAATHDRPGTPPGTVFLASSAGALYAGSHDPPFDEDTPIAPISGYGAIKAEMESRARAWAADTGGHVVVGRIANLYGPAQGLEKPQGLVSHIIKAHLTRTPISIYVPLDTMRDYLYAPDCGELVVDALRHPRPGGGAARGTVVTKILASHQQVTVGRLLAEMRRIFKRSPQVVLGSSPQAALQARDLRLTSRVWPELDRRQLTPLHVGMLATTEYLRAVQREGRL